MSLIYEQFVARFFPAQNTPLGSALGVMVLALGALGVAVILLAILSVFTGRRRSSTYSNGNGSDYSGETYGDYSPTSNSGSWFDGQSSSWFDSGDTGSAYSDFSSSGGDFGSDD